MGVGGGGAPTHTDLSKFQRLSHVNLAQRGWTNKPANLLRNENENGPSEVSRTELEASSKPDGAMMRLHSDQQELEHAGARLWKWKWCDGSEVTGQAPSPGQGLMPVSFPTL